MVRQSLLFAAALLALSQMSGCSSSTPETADSAAEHAAQEPAARQPTVFDDQLKALEDAKEVEETLRKAKADRDKAIEEAGG